MGEDPNINIAPFLQWIIGLIYKNFQGGKAGSAMALVFFFYFKMKHIFIYH